MGSSGYVLGVISLYVIGVGAGSYMRGGERGLKIGVLGSVV